MFDDTSKPHQGQPVIEKGVALDQASTAVILLHGRGASAESILTLADEVHRPEAAWLAPQAAHYTWYPFSFLAPIEQNEPGLSSALEMLSELVERIEDADVPKGRIILAGFSQGACLSLEFAARNPARYGGVVALSGGVIGPEVEQGRYNGDMDRTPVFLGCSDYDHHIPEERVHETADLFERLGAGVTKKIYPGLGHTINEDELDHFRKVLDSVIQESS
ncbi:MAG: alpha/beta hydrolase [Bacteroidota bacterium]